MVDQPFQRIEVVINPAAGNDEPILNPLNDALVAAGVQWNISVTQPQRSATTLVSEALERGADLVAVYGGDGTLHEAVPPLIEAGIPLCILPGGTGNALATQLKIPRMVGDAIGLALGPSPRIQTIDVCTAGGKTFLLNAGTGLYGGLVDGADRDLKDRYGWLAYLFSTAQTLIKQPPPVHYRLTIDGVTIEQPARACLIANVSSLGVLGLSLSKKVAVDDGLLDAILLDASWQTIVASIGTLSGVEPLAEGLHHWQGREITIESDPPGQDVFVDGENTPLHQTPVTVSVLPQALQVIVPAER